MFLPKTFRTALVIASSSVVIACLPVSIDAPFAKDPAQRQAFVRSVVPGQTRVETLIAQYGKPTTIATAEAGKNPDSIYSWAGGVGQSSGVTYARVRSDGIVERAWSASKTAPDNFDTGTAARPAAAAPAAANPRPVAARASGAVTQQTAQAMSDFAQSPGATPAAFVARFGSPVLKQAGRFSGTQNWTYGTEPRSNSVLSNVCKEAPFVWVTMDLPGNRIVDVRTNVFMC